MHRDGIMEITVSFFPDIGGIKYFAKTYLRIKPSTELLNNKVYLWISWSTSVTLNKTHDIVSDV